MRMLFVLLVGSLSSCSGLVQCKPGSCAVGEHCVYVGSATAPKCLTACDLADGGGCSTGERCGCGGTCQGCENCVPVCQP